MFDNPIILQIAIVVGVSGTLFALAMLFMLIKGDDQQLEARLDGLNDSGRSILRLGRGSVRKNTTLKGTLKAALQRMGGKLLPKQGDERRTDLQMRLLHAGLYTPSAASIIAAVKMIFMLTPPAVGFLIGFLGLWEMKAALLYGAGMGAVGMLLPGLWLGRRKKKRQSTLRRSLPDFLDLIIVCLESGMSFESALQRVADELRVAHPVLTGELAVVQREIAMGRTTDDALRNFAVRSDIDVVKTLATFVQQSRQFGASMADTLRIHSDMLREKREQYAEELAQKAAVKILFPTLLFIFPAIFVVLIGPAVIDIQDKFSNEPNETAPGLIGPG